MEVINTPRERLTEASSFHKRNSEKRQEKISWEQPLDSTTSKDSQQQSHIVAARRAYNFLLRQLVFLWDLGDEEHRVKKRSCQLENWTERKQISCN